MRDLIIDRIIEINPNGLRNHVDLERWLKSVSDDRLLAMFEIMIEEQTHPPGFVVEWVDEHEDEIMIEEEKQMGGMVDDEHEEEITEIELVSVCKEATKHLLSDHGDRVWTKEEMQLMRELNDHIGIVHRILRTLNNPK